MIHHTIFDDGPCKEAFCILSPILENCRSIHSRYLLIDCHAILIQGTAPGSSTMNSNTGLMISLMLVLT